MSRVGIYQRLLADAQSIEAGSLGVLGIGPDDLWNVESVDNPDRGKPFLVIAWATENPTGWGTTAHRDLLVWAHDDSADYTRIDAILQRVKELLVSMTHEEGVSQVRFTGASGDLYDDGFRTITRNYGFRVNARTEEMT